MSLPPIGSRLGGGGMITFITHLRVRRENAPAFEALLTEVCAKYVPG